MGNPKHPHLCGCGLEQREEEAGSRELDEVGDGADGVGQGRCRRLLSPG